MVNNNKFKKINSDLLENLKTISQLIEGYNETKKIGSKEDGKLNALKCVGSKIAIPSGYKKLYILAASSNVNGATANFGVDKKTFSTKVDYFSGFIGQATA